MNNVYRQKESTASAYLNPEERWTSFRHPFLKRAALLLWFVFPLSLGAWAQAGGSMSNPIELYLENVMCGYQVGYDGLWGEMDSDNKQWYSFTVDVPSTVTVYCWIEYTYDANGYVYDSNGNLLASKLFLQSESSLVYPLGFWPDALKLDLQPGTYYVANQVAGSSVQEWRTTEVLVIPHTLPQGSTAYKAINAGTLVVGGAAYTNSQNTSACFPDTNWNGIPDIHYEFTLDQPAEVTITGYPASRLVKSDGSQPTSPFAPGKYYLSFDVSGTPTFNISILASPPPVPPVPPGNLAASAASSSSISLSWTDNSDNETGFEIERSLTSGSGFTLVYTGGGNATSWTNTGLTESTTYYYRIRSLNTAGYSPYSSEASATTPLSPPATPGGLTATAESTTSVGLTWIDNSNNESAFQIERSGSSENGYLLIHTTSAGATSYTDNGLNQSTTYYYRVRAANSGGNSAYTSVAYVTTPGIPAAPGGLTVTATSSASISLTWSDNSINETGFQIERSASAEGPYELIHTTGANTTTYISGGLTSETAYYYRVRAINAFGSSSFTTVAEAQTPVNATQKALSDFAFLYRYDARKRMTHKKVPGADWVYMVYDDRDRLVMTQDGNQRAKTPREWTFTKYDAFNRPVLTGIYKDAANREQSVMQQDVNSFYNGAAQETFYEQVGGSVHAYTNRSFPGVSSESDYLTVTYYDRYTVSDTWPGYQYVSAGLTQTVNQATYAQPATAFDRVKGQVTATKVKVLDGGNDWLRTVSYYDDKYRVIQVVSDNHKGTERISSLYDFTGKVLNTKTTHSVNNTTHSISRRFVYDHAARLLETWHELNEQSEVLLSKNEYNELGQLVTKKLHQSGTPAVADPLVGQPGVTYADEIVSDEYNNETTFIAKTSIRLIPGFHVPAGSTFTARIGLSQADADQINGATFAQEIDYRYNIRGWLDNINEVEASNSNDLFSMDLNYNDPKTNGGSAQYNGNISQTIWKGPDAIEKSYGYHYDPMNRLTDAQFFNVSTPAQNGRFNEKIGNIALDRPGYDLNGNILNLFRNGKTGEMAGGVVTYGEMDNLKYEEYTGNRLGKVTDEAIDTEGFKDGSNTGNDYEYDPNGNMIYDLNIGSSLTDPSNKITYNHLNLPQRVQKSSTKYIEYVYDATGRKLRQVAVEENQTKTTDYAGEFIYENDVLQFINHEEGRVIMTGTAPEYQYHLKDHLGNIRVTFTTKDEVEETTATLEEENADEEQAHFLRYDKIRKVRASYFDHTNNNNPVSTNGYAVRLSGGENERFGLARSISVMPGDKITAEVYAKYVDAGSTDPNFTALLANIAGQIAAGNTTTGLVVDGGSFSSSTASFPFPVENGETKVSNTNNGVGPKAYLNWLVFDRDYNFILSKSGFYPLSATPKEDGTDVAHERLYSPEITIDQAGYVYIYLSNEEDQPLEVYFDDFKVKHVKSPVVQMNDYYPFGLQFNSYTRENSTPQDYLFNGKEEQTELDLGWLDYGARMYQPELGRFTRIDRMVEKYMPASPYGYVANNPISNVDINGDYITIMGEDENGNKYSVLYENGKAYHYTKDKDGNITKGDEYDGKNEFIEKTVSNLNQIGTTMEGEKVVDRLSGSKSEYGINKASKLTTSRFEPNQTSGGGNLYYSNDKGFLDGVSFKGTYTLGHELYHGYQRDLGVAGYDALTRVKGQDGILPLGEIQAVGFENYLRAKFNEVGFNNARETYTSKFLNITTPVKIKEFTTMGGWPSIGLGWTTPWNVTDFVNKKATWINLREVALKKHTSN